MLNVPEKWSGKGGGIRFQWYAYYQRAVTGTGEDLSKDKNSC
jgi:hypothetical protein